MDELTIAEYQNYPLKLFLVNVQFFFSWTFAGLTNRPQVRDSDSGHPLRGHAFHMWSGRALAPDPPLG